MNPAATSFANIPTFVVQKQIWEERNYGFFLDCLRNYGTVLEVEVVPFTDQLVPEISDRPDFVLGSGRLVDIARKRGWPTFESFSPNLDDIVDSGHLLNGVSKKMKISELGQLNARCVFVKPLREKLFTGLVIVPADLEEKAFDSLVQCSTTHVNNLQEEMVYVSEPVNITKEYRFFVFQNKIAAGSSYGRTSANGYERINQDHYLWGMTQSLIDSFKREITGTVDVTLHQGEVKIIELNNLNSAGVYECDPDAIARSFVRLKLISE